MAVLCLVLFIGGHLLSQIGAPHLQAHLTIITSSKTPISKLACILRVKVSACSRGVWGSTIQPITEPLETCSASGVDAADLCFSLALARNRELVEVAPSSPDAKAWGPVRSAREAPHFRAPEPCPELVSGPLTVVAPFSPTLLFKIIFIYFSLIDDCSTILVWFLPHSNMT